VEEVGSTGRDVVVATMTEKCVSATEDQVAPKWERWEEAERMKKIEKKRVLERLMWVRLATITLM